MSIDNVVNSAIAGAQKVLDDARASNPEAFARRDALMAQISAAQKELNGLNLQIQTADVTRATQLVRTLTVVRPRPGRINTIVAAGPTGRGG